MLSQTSATTAIAQYPGKMRNARCQRYLRTGGCDCE